MWYEHSRAIISNAAAKAARADLRHLRQYGSDHALAADARHSSGCAFLELFLEPTPNKNSQRSHVTFT
jgi:hypothetical protein